MSIWLKVNLIAPIVFIGKPLVDYIGQGRHRSKFVLYQLYVDRKTNYCCKLSSSEKFKSTFEILWTSAVILVLLWSSFSLCLFRYGIGPTALITGSLRFLFPVVSSFVLIESDCYVVYSFAKEFVLLLMKAFSYYHSFNNFKITLSHESTLERERDREGGRGKLLTKGTGHMA